MDVIFSDCTVHVNSRAVILFMPQLSLSRATSTVRDVVLTFNDNIFQEGTEDELDIATGWPMYRVLMLALPQAFPAAHQLTIILNTVLNGWENYSEANSAPFPGWVSMADPELVKSGILAPLDAMRGSFGSLRECQVVLSWEVFDIVAREEPVEGTGITYSDHELDISKWDGFWRSVASDDRRVGYWVRKNPPNILTLEEIYSLE
jgi:hypothetical protein